MKLFFLLITLLSSISRLFATDIYVEIGGRIQSSLTQEYVYEDQKAISRLDWTDKLVPALSMAGSIEFFNLLLQARLNTTVPVKGGVMEDYDFLIAGSNEVSHYSKHDAYLDKDFTGTLALSYVIRLGVWNLEPGIGFSYSNRKWSAQDGYVQYPVSGIWNGNEPKQPVSGTIISYEQALWFPFTSLNVAYRLNCFEASFLGEVSPIVHGETIDTHFMRSTRFYDTLGGSGGIVWNVGITLMYYPVRLRHLGVFLRGSYGAIAGLTGTTSSGAIGLDDGTLVIDRGYGSKMEQHTGGVSLGIVLQVVP